MPNTRPSGNWIAQNSALFSATPVSTVLQDEVGTVPITMKNTGQNQFRV